MALMHAINIVILTFPNRELIITLGMEKTFPDKELDNKVIQKSFISFIQCHLFLELTR